jgi:hypothetical protein
VTKAQRGVLFEIDLGGHEDDVYSHVNGIFLGTIGQNRRYSGDMNRTEEVRRCMEIDMRAIWVGMRELVEEIVGVYSINLVVQQRLEHQLLLKEAVALVSLSRGASCAKRGSSTKGRQ